MTVQLDDNLARRLEIEIEGSGRDTATVIRAALNAYLKVRPTGESCLTIARRHHLVGVARDLPADLSTNPEHFREFAR